MGNGSAFVSAALAPTYLVGGAVGSGAVVLTSYLTYGNISGIPPFPATKAAVTSNWLNSYTASTGLFTATQPAASDLSNGVTGSGLVVLQTGPSLLGDVTLGEIANYNGIATVNGGVPPNTPLLTYSI